MFQRTAFAPTWRWAVWELLPEQISFFQLILNISGLRDRQRKVLWRDYPRMGEIMNFPFIISDTLWHTSANFWHPSKTILPNYLLFWSSTTDVFRTKSHLNTQTHMNFQTSLLNCGHWLPLVLDSPAFLTYTSYYNLENHGIEFYILQQRFAGIVHIVSGKC